MLVRKTFTRAATVAAIVGLVAVMFVPGAAAQTGNPTMTVTKITLTPALIFPESGTGTLTVDFTYNLPTLFHNAAQATGPGVPVKASFQCPSYVTPVGPTSLVLAWPQAGGQEAKGSFTFDVTVGREAPGLQALPCKVKVTAEGVGGGTVPGADSGEVPFTVKADYYSLIQAKISKKVQQAGPQKDVPFDIELSNFGNARTQIAFEVANKPEGGKWNILVPENIILDSPNAGTGKPNDIATVTITTTYKNGWNNEQGAFQVLMKPTSADQPDKVGNQLSANMLVRVRGVYVPGFEPVVMLGTILGAVLVTRLRREDE